MESNVRELPWSPTIPEAVRVGPTQIADVGDTLYLRVFRDPDLGNVISVVELMVTGGSDETRTLGADTAGWCDGASKTGTHVYDAVVTDRPWAGPREFAPDAKSR